MSEYQHAGYIDGELVAGKGAAIEVEDPSTGGTFARLAGLDSAQVESAIASARSAFDSGVWSGLPAQQRVAALGRFIAALAARKDEVTDIVVREAGCPRHSGVMMAQVLAPLKHAGDTLKLFLSLPEMEENPLPLDERINPMGQVVQSLRRYTPTGVVAGIAAYNFPFYTALWKIMPALVTGNTLVLRPSPLTPLSALVFAQAASEAELPPGVLNVVLEAGLEGGKLLSTHRDVDMVAFTGSTAVGEQIMAQAAPTMKRLQLELGGKSAQVFLPDALDQVVANAMIVCMSHAGQGCALGTRIFVPEQNKAEILQQLAGVVGSVRIGPADDPETQMGPVISRAQVERCEHYVQAAVAHGGKVVVGGARPEGLGDGFFFQPTVLDLPDNSNPAAQDEIFGPVVSVIGYRDLDHAVAMANDSRFGLSGYVHGKDRRAALDVALKIKSGTVNVNAGVMSAYASSGGQRASGIGRERGVEGLRIYQQLSCLNIGGI
ncbi:aldehyde dehydrogenase family protein [Mangrovimicrobium sediminis]|uniref:Aldehyde dehydrogenase family protein n=1 Tax=Mangrovimicrobium sediminis TaxID=2562682 RepID=A0A4Z0LVH9_9GAMM|nr:aldehyde dehydrogenase family protein [Haliea sp. SAOS-164]TGD71280.1 aldehyde dehydrogenase family protein [Haliea sp. SAOS-164]